MSAPDPFISMLPTFKCPLCATFYEGCPRGIVSLKGNITAGSSLTHYDYGLCHDCYSDLKQRLGKPLREECK
jgi:hypothetical protein